MSLSSGLKNITLKSVQTQVRSITIQDNTIIKPNPPKPTVQHPYHGPPQVVLLITKHWVIYEWLQPTIKKILFCTEAAYETMKKTQPSALDAYVHIQSFKSLTTGLIELNAQKLHQVYHFTHVVVLAEEDLIRGARIRKSLGITHGQDVASSLRYRDKIVMKTILQEHNIRVPKFAAVESASDIIDFVKDNGCEIVVKPRKGYSSVNTWIIKNEQQLESFLNSGFNTIVGFDSALDLDVESFITGEMYHIDGLVYDGKVKLCWPSKYINSCSDFQKSTFLGSYTLHPKNSLTKRLQSFTVKVIEALGGPSCFPFHAEVWHTPDDELVFCEIASRTGGAWVRHVVLRLFGILQDKTFSQWQVQQEISNLELGDDWDSRLPDLDELAGWIFIYPSIGILKEIPSSCPLSCVVESQNFGEVGEVFKSRENCVDSIFSVVFTGKTEQIMQQNAQTIVDWFSKNTVYGPLS